MKKRRLLIKFLHEKSIDFTSTKISAESILEATTDPRCFIKVFELARKAQRDDSTLVSLENQKDF